MEEGDWHHPPSLKLKESGLSLLGFFLLPSALGCLGDEALLEGAGGHAHIADFAIGHEGLNALNVHAELALGDSGDVRTDTAGLLRFTGAPDNAALHRAFASQFTNTCHKYLSISLLKSRKA